MTGETFTEPEESRENWIDVRMTDPDEGEWDIDVVVVDGQVEDVDDGRAEAVLSTVAERNGIDLQ